MFCRYLGLVVFSDVMVTRRPGFCNASLGFGECLDGQCYPFFKKCDGQRDCQDGTDEAGCKYTFIVSSILCEMMIGVLPSHHFLKCQSQVLTLYFKTFRSNIQPHRNWSIPKVQIQ